MKILSLFGTRPEIIRLSVILRKLDETCDHVSVYTNQNADPNLSTIFFSDLKVRKPNYYFTATGSLGEFLANGFEEFNAILDNENPDKILILGDTNSVLLGILAVKRGIPIYHMEAGNRCYDTLVPEETNRMIIDACSRYNMPYTDNSKENLIREGHSKNFVYKIGNPIKEVLDSYGHNIEQSTIHEELGLAPWDGGAMRSYAFLTFHRTENVDNAKRSASVVSAINEIAEDIPVVFPMHPRTKDQFAKHGVTLSENVIITDPIGFFDCAKLEKYAKVILTDSGTCPEDAMIFGIPCIVLRNTTERQELMENGTLILAGTKKEDILRAYYTIDKMKQMWLPLDDYSKHNVSDTVIRFLVGQGAKTERKGHDEY